MSGHKANEVCLTVILAAVLFAVITLGLYVKLPGTYEQDEAAVDGAYEMTVPAEVREMARELARQQEAALNSSVEIRINGEPRADAVTGRCNLMAGNPGGNDKNLRITVSLDGNGEVIYRSPLLKPGERVAYVTLEKVPDTGEYSATAEFDVLDQETGKSVGAVDAGILLKVE